MADILTQQPVLDHSVPRFALTEPERRDWRHFAEVSAGSVAAHVVIALIVGGLAAIPMQTRTAPQISIRFNPRDAAKLVAPPSSVLTQKEANKGKISTEFNVASLSPRPSQPNVPASPGAAALPRQKFTLPDKKVPIPGMPSITPDAPSIDTTQFRAAAPPPPALGNQPVPPPQIEPAEKPKLAFERPGVPMGSSTPTGIGRVPVPTPSRSVEDAARQVARGGGRGLMVGDEDASTVGVSPSSAAVPIAGKLGSAVELLSDPMGADLRPYLLQVLASVRRNWFPLVRDNIGWRGVVAVQFAIARDGTVPKLVISGPSGSQPLDRASVAAISASNPFPPLPPDFKGGQIRLQFAFKYNVR